MLRNIVLGLVGFVMAATVVQGAAPAGSLALAADKMIAKNATDPMNVVVRDYVKIQDALASDSMDGVVAAAKSIGGAAKKDQALRAAASTMADAKDIKQARAAMKGLSKIIADWVRKNRPTGFDVYNCSMAKADWVQKSGPVRNPYYGKEMLECGEKLE